MCDDRRFERQRGGGGQSLLDIVSETAPLGRKICMQNWEFLK